MPSSGGRPLPSVPEKVTIFLSLSPTLLSPPSLFTSLLHLFSEINISSLLVLLIPLEGQLSRKKEREREREGERERWREGEYLKEEKPKLRRNPPPTHTSNSKQSQPTALSLFFPLSLSLSLFLSLLSRVSFLCMEMMNSTTAAGGGNAASTSATNGSLDASAPRRNSKRPKYSKFTQQELPACKPILTPQWVISAFIVVSIIFVPIGVASLFASRDVVEIIDRYEDVCVPPNMSDDKVAYIQNPTIDKACTRTLTVPKDMKQPIYVYYQIDNFYQNHRRYVKSRNDAQLRDPSHANDTGSCDPEDTTGNRSPIVPCGLIAWSLFNDTYSLTRNSQPLSINKKGISWKSDRDHKFGKKVYPNNFQNGILIGGAKLNASKPLSEQEDLIVWMRTAALPTFRKLYGKIEVDLKMNDVITVDLKNNYNTYSFGGKKKLVLSTTSWLGGKNNFLGIAYLTVGGLCFSLATVFTVIYLIKPRKLGDPSYLSWNRNPVGN